MSPSRQVHAHTLQSAAQQVPLVAHIPSDPDLNMPGPSGRSGTPPMVPISPQIDQVLRA